MSPRVWITRTRPGADRTARRVAALGATPVIQPLLAIDPLALTLPDLGTYAALAFTSGHGVTAFADLSDCRDLPVFAVGTTTADMARAVGFRQVHDAIGDVHDLARMIDAAALAGPVLSPGAAERADDLSGGVARTRIDQLALYRAVEITQAPPPGVEIILLHSPRAARHLTHLWPTGVRLPTVVTLSHAVAAPIVGPTADTAQVIVADTPDEAALMRALGKALSRV